MKTAFARSPARLRSATAMQAPRSFRNLCGLHDKEARRLQIERQRAGDSSKTLKRRADGMGDAGGNLGVHRHAGDIGHRPDLLRARSRHAASSPFDDGARLWPDPAMAM